MAEAIEAIGEKKKSVQDIMAQMQAQYLAMDAVSAGAPVAGVGAANDEGIRIVKGGQKSGVMSANDNGSIDIGKPNLPVNADVRALMERAIAHIQLETNQASNELSQKRLEQNAAAYEKKHETQLKSIDKQVAEARKQGDESPLTKAFRWIGVAAAMATAVIASVASGGAATGLIVAAATALATAIGEESGAFKAIEKEISKSLQENQGMSKKDADAAAQYITMAITTAVQMAGDITGSFLTTAQEKVASTMIEEGSKVAANSVVGDMALDVAKEIGDETMKDAVLKTTEEVAKATEKAAEKAAEQGVKIAEKSVPEAVKDAMNDFTKELELNLAKVDVSADKVQKLVDGVKGIEEKATQLMSTAEKIAKVQKAMFVVNAAISVAETSGSTAENVQGINKQREMRELDALQEIAQAEEQRFLQKLSAENETADRLRKKVQDLQDSVIAMAQSREDSLQTIAQMV